MDAVPKPSADLPAANERFLETCQQQAIARARAEELHRRGLEADGNQFRREQHEWRTRRTQEESRLRQRAKELERRERALEQARRKLEQRLQDDHAQRRQRLAELEELDGRVKNQRAALSALKLEAGRLEDELWEKPTAPSPFDPNRSPRLLEAFTRLAADLHDEARRLIEVQASLGERNQLWQTELDTLARTAALERDDLQHRAKDLTPREEALVRRELDLSVRQAELDRQARGLQGREARLTLFRGAFQCERNRLVALVKARSVANREQRRLLQHLQQAWIKNHRRELERYQRQQDQCEQARRHCLELAARLEKRLEDLQQRERLLVEKDLVVTQAQHQLIAQDARPAQAEQELARRQKHWARVALRPARRIKKHHDELQRRAENLERLRLELRRQRNEVEGRRAESLRLAEQLGQQEADLAAERSHWRNLLSGLEQERKHLEQRIRDLEQQLDTLAHALVNAEEVKPPTALAA